MKIETFIVIAAILIISSSSGRKSIGELVDKMKTIPNRPTVMTNQAIAAAIKECKKYDLRPDATRSFSGKVLDVNCVPKDDGK